MIEDNIVKLNILVDSLRSNKNIEILKLEMLEGFTESDLNEIIRDYKINLHPTLKFFYLNYESFELNWLNTQIINNEEHITEGNIKILPLDIVLGGYYGRNWKDTLWFEHDEKEIKDLRPLDMFYPDDTNCICLNIKERILGNSIFMYSNDYGLHDLQIDIYKYFEFLLVSKGIVRWPFVISKKKNLYDYVNFELNFYQTLSDLFPKEIKLQNKLKQEFNLNG